MLSTERATRPLMSSYTIAISIILISDEIIDATIKVDNKTQFFDKLKEFGTSGYIDHVNGMYYSPYQIKRIKFEFI